MSREAGEVQDRRIQKTQNLLRNALHALVGEKPYDDITVTEILDRANVGRSTFYTHFRDKDDLLLSGLYDMVHSARPTASPGAEWYERMLWFSLPMFEYHHRHRQERESSMGVGEAGVLHEHLHRAIALLITDSAKTELLAARTAPRVIPAEVLVDYVASTFVLVFHWWLESTSALSPQEADSTFRALVLPTLIAYLGTR